MVARYKNPAPIKVSSINLNSDNHVNIVNTTKNNPNYQQNWKCQLQGAGGRGRSP